MLLVGLTGGIASGKSTVAAMLAERGAVVLDADVLARAAVERGTPGFDQVVARFGPDVLDARGELDRARLAEQVFGDEASRRALEAIVHPEVRRLIAHGVRPHRGSDRVVVVDSPLLIETGAHETFDVVVVVAASREQQVARLLADRRMDERGALSRIDAQLPLEEKARVADVVLDNEGSREDLRSQVDRLWAELSSRTGARR